MKQKVIIHGVEVFLNEDGQWQDVEGTEYGLADDGLSKDEQVRLGVGWLSLPVTHPFTPAAIFHDFAYSSPAFMRSNGRSVADRMFLDQMLAIAGNNRALKAQAYALYATVRGVGWWYWDCPETRWK